MIVLAFKFTSEKENQKPGNHPNATKNSQSEKAFLEATPGILRCSRSNSHNCTHDLSHAKINSRSPSRGDSQNWWEARQRGLNHFSTKSRSVSSKIEVDPAHQRKGCQQSQQRNKIKRRNLTSEKHLCTRPSSKTPMLHCTPASRLGSRAPALQHRKCCFCRGPACVANTPLAIATSLLCTSWHAASTSQ